MSNRYPTVLLFGPPGAGKGTQGAMLATIPGFFHFSTGDMFRHLDKTSELGKTFLRYSTRGELVPDELTVQLWQENMRAHATLGNYKPGADLLLLDGLPRNASQARLMDAHIDVLAVVHLVFPDKQAMVERLQKRALEQKRPDDAKEEVILRRRQVYEDETRPVLEHYSSDLIHDVDAMGSQAGVLRDILSVLAPILDAQSASRQAAPQPA